MNRIHIFKNKKNISYWRRAFLWLRIKSLSLLAILIAGLILFPCAAQADTVTYQKGDGKGTTSETDDSTMRSGYSNMGSNLDLMIDSSSHYHTVIKFPNIFGSGANQIPLGSTINSATLTVEVTNPGNTVNVYQLIESWIEANVTWTARTSSLSWTNTGADGTSSRYGTTVATFSPSSTGTYNITVTATVQNWSDGETNEGWVLTDTGSNGVDLRSSEYGTVANRPKLTVDYIPGSTTTIGDGTSPADNTVVRDSTNNAVDAFTLATDIDTDTVTALTVTFTGTDVTDVASSGVKIYDDSTGGTPNEWDAADTLKGTASFSGTTASVTVSISVDSSATQYLVTYDIATGATNTNTLQGAITAATATNTRAYNDTTDATLTISAPATTTIGDGTSPPSKDVAQSSTNDAVDAFTLFTDGGTDTVTALTVTFTGTAVADVATSGVKIYDDSTGGTPNEWDAADTLKGTASFSGTTASVTVSISVDDSATQYLVTYDIAVGATNTNTLLGAITGATFNNTLANNDTTDATLTVSQAAAPATLTNVATATNVGNPEAYTLNFGWTATAGRLLVLTASWDEDAVSASEDSGEWRKIYHVVNNMHDVTGAMYYKVADGTETSVSLSWIGAEDISIRVGEYSGIAKGDPLDVSSSGKSDATAVQNLSSGTTAATSDSYELAVAMMGSEDYNLTETGRSWSNSFSEATYLGSGSGDPGLSVAEKDLTSTGTVETTFTTTDTGDQMVVFVATFKHDDGAPGLAGLLDMSDAAPNRQYTNKAVALDLTGSDTVSVSGGGAEVRNVTDASAWLTSVAVDDGETVEFRMTSSASNSTAVNTTVTMSSFNQVWTITTMPPVSWIIGSTDRVFTSPDGTTWTLWDQTGTFPAGQSMHQLEYGGGYWLIGTGDSAALFESPDGVNWTNITPVEFTQGINGILYHMGIWYVRTDSKNFASTDRVNWTDLGNPGDGGSSGQTQTIKGGKHYVVISRNSSTSSSHDMWTSPATTNPASISFTENTNMSDTAGGGLAYADGVWVAAVADTNSEAPYYMIGAPTGTWTASNANSESYVLGFGNGIFTIIRGDYAQTTAPSIWNPTTYESSLNPRYGTVFGDGLFVSAHAHLSSVKYVAHSTDGITYTAVVNMGDSTFRTLEYGGAHNEPDDFPFTDQTDVALSTAINSNILTLANFTSTLKVFAGNGAEVCKNDSDDDLSNGCSTTWTAGDGTVTVVAGDKIGVRMTSDASALTEKVSTVQIGTRVYHWGVTTEEAITTIGDGTSPASKDVEASSTNNAVDAFTLVTNAGTDTVTAL
ncbi:hypothetical protein LCGC14_1344210, partial [marine sediment metagenome]